jgi:hypothetical protein
LARLSQRFQIDQIGLRSRIDPRFQIDQTTQLARLNQRFQIDRIGLRFQIDLRVQRFQLVRSDRINQRCLISLRCQIDQMTRPDQINQRFQIDPRVQRSQLIPLVQKDRKVQKLQIQKDQRSQSYLMGHPIPIYQIGQIDLRFQIVQKCQKILRKRMIQPNQKDHLPHCLQFPRFLR